MLTVSKVTIIQGNPDEGKTTFILALITLLPNGEPLPEEEIGAEPSLPQVQS